MQKLAGVRFVRVVKERQTLARATTEITKIKTRGNKINL